MAWSGDLGPEQVLPLRYLGRDLVAYRGLGVVRVHDRYCQHLGASLAHGGQVTEHGIRCPFHGWAWAPDGRNAAIPYQDRPNTARRLVTWPVVERNESIYVWHDRSCTGPRSARRPWPGPSRVIGLPSVWPNRFTTAG